MSKAIASSWSKVFESDLFKTFQTAADKAITKLMEQVQAACPPGLKGRAAMQSDVSMNESKLAMEKITGIVHDALQTHQKDISRSLIPHVQRSLKDGYDQAMEERGTGSVARQKASFHNYVDTNKHHIFTGGAETVMSRLNAAAEAVGVALQEKMLELAEKVRTPLSHFSFRVMFSDLHSQVEVSIAVLWEGGGDDPAEVRARKVVVTHINEIIEQASLWLQSERLHAEDLQAQNDMAE